VKKNIHYDFWNKKAHYRRFNFWLGFRNFYFNWIYGNFQEQRYLLKKINAINKRGISIIDIGCATATTLRFLLNNNINNFSYTGVDLSSGMIKYCKMKYKKHKFLKTLPNINFYKKFKKKFDLVYSRDTVLHQTDPFGFLNNLINLTGRFLIIRLRTRDVGKTELNYKKSCQKHYGNNWAPYIVINTNELLSFLKKYPKISKITLNRSYQILGGVNERYLPKDLYLEKTKGAETTILIEKSEKSIKNKKIKFDNDLEGHLFQFKHKYLNFIYLLINKSINFFLRKN